MILSKASAFTCVYVSSPFLDLETLFQHFSFPSSVSKMFLTLMNHFYQLTNILLFPPTKKQNFLLTPLPLPVSAPIPYFPLQQKGCLFLLSLIHFLLFSLKPIPIRLMSTSLQQNFSCEGHHQGQVVKPSDYFPVISLII